MERHAVPTVYTRVAEWLGPKRDKGLLPAGWNPSASQCNIHHVFFVTRGEFVWEHFSRPYSPGVVAWQGSTCTAKTDFGVQGTRMNRILGDLHGKSVVRLCSIRHIQRCSHAFIDLQTHVPSRGLNLC